MTRARALLASLLPLTWALASVAAGQDKVEHKPGVTISFRGLGTTGANVLGKPRRFVPMTAVLENDGDADVDGLLRVYRSVEVQAGVAFSSVPEQALFYERPVKVPRRGKRVEEIYYYCQDREPDRICVAFEQSNGETVVPTHPKLDLRPGELLALSVTSSDQDDAVPFPWRRQLVQDLRRAAREVPGIPLYGQAGFFIHVHRPRHQRRGLSCRVLPCGADE